MGSRKKWLFKAIALMVTGVTLSGCLIVEEINTATGQFGLVDFPMQHDYGVAIAIPGYEGMVHSCLFRGSEVPGRRDICRVIQGREQNWDLRNWHVYEDPTLAYKHVPGYGYTIATDGGGVYEGCKRLNTNNYVDWECDYRVVFMASLVNNESAPSYFFRKLKDWSIHTGSSIGCAAFIAAVSAGGPVTIAGLAGCADAPL